MDKPRLMVGDIFFYRDRDVFLIGKVKSPVNNIFVFFDVIRFVGNKGDIGNRCTKESKVYNKAIVITNEYEL